jgi:ABC transport permease subunit
MKVIGPVLKRIPRLPNVKQQAIKLSENAIRKTEKVNQFFLEVGAFTLFFWLTVKATVSRDFEFREFLRQCYLVGNKTLPLITITGLVIGLVLTIQSRPILADFGAISLLPNMVTLSIVKEMGPVVTALICAGKIGSGMGAELGSMKVTEQIDAMEVSSTNPIRFLVVPRVLAATFMIPILVLYADAFGIIDVMGENVHELNETDLAAMRMKIGFLFQSGALYDSMTIKENLAFPLKRIKRNLSSKQIDEKINEALENVGLSDTHDIECARATADRMIMLKDGKVYMEGSLEDFETSSDELMQSFFKPKIKHQR